MTTPLLSPAFQHALDFVLAREGGYVNDPADKGGETKYGISDKRDGIADGKTDVNGDGKPDTAIKDLTPEQAAQIYFRDYWQAAYCTDWPDGISLFVFDAAVQHGVKAAIRQLQSAAGVTADGIVGPNTTRAVIGADPEWLLNRCFLRRSRFYADIIKSNASQGIRVPLVYIDIDNSQAMGSAPAQSRKVIVIGHQDSAGTATALTQNRITSDGMAEKLYGRGSQLAEMLKMHRKANSYTETWAMGLAELSAGAAAKATLAVVGTATAAGTLALLINGVSVQVGVDAGDTRDDIASAIIDAVTKLPSTQVAATLKATTTDSVDLTANWKGICTNAMDVRLNYYPGEQLPAGINVTLTGFAGGTGTPDIAAAVAALGDDWYTDITFGFNDTQSLNTIRDELIVRWGPLKMIEAQLWAGYRGTHAESGTFGDARNDWLISCMSTNQAPQPHWLWAASYGGIASYYLAIDPARPLQTLVMPGILPPAKEVRWDMQERNLLLHDGLATHFVDAGGNVCIEREITMYRVNQYGDLDTSYLDVQSPATLGRIRYIIKNRFSSRYPRHKLAGDDVLELLDPGQPVMTPKIARAELLDIALTELVPAGLVEDFEDYKETLDVDIDASDANRLNFVAHPNLVNQLRVLAGLIQFKQ